MVKTISIQNPKIIEIVSKFVGSVGRNPVEVAENMIITDSERRRETTSAEAPTPQRSRKSQKQTSPARA